MALYHLATNPDVQEKAASEVLEVAAREGNKDGKISGEAFSELSYLDNCLTESLRMTALPALLR